MVCVSVWVCVLVGVRVFCADTYLPMSFCLHAYMYAHLLVHMHIFVHVKVHSCRQIYAGSSYQILMKELEEMSLCRDDLPWPDNGESERQISISFTHIYEKPTDRESCTSD